MKSKKTSLFASLIRNYKFKSVFFSYFKGILLVALIVFSLFATVAFSIFNMLARDSMAQYHQNSLAKTADLLHTITFKIDQTHHMLATNPDVTVMLFRSKDDLDAWHDRGTVYKLNDELFYMTVESSGVESIYVYSTINEYLFSWTEFRPLEDYVDNAWLNQLGDRMQNGQDSVQFARKRLPGAETFDTITFVNAIRLNNNLIGYTVFNVNLSFFETLIDHSLREVQESFMVLSADGYILYDTDITRANSTLPEDDSLYGVFSNTLESGGEVAYLQQQTVSSTLSNDGRFVLISRASNALMLNMLNSYISVMVWSVAVGILTSVVLALFMSVRMYSYIVKLITVFNTSYDGGVQTSNGEMNFITENILRVMDKNNTVEHELTEKLADLKKTQSIALFTQINPHFILNTLQMINLDILREAKRDTTATRTISLLSEILRSNLRTRDYLVPLQQELKLAKSYLEIENTRNKNKYSIFWDVDDRLLEYTTVKFILQPVLENSIVHGLTSKDSPFRTIAISVHEREECLMITVYDNGMGMAPQTLEALRARLAESFIQENAHIGLCNVDMRIRLIFGEDYGVGVDSEEGKSTTVTIKMPLVKNLPKD